MMKVKVRDIVEAARKNGLKHIRNSYFDYESEQPAGCIMAQAFYNLTGELDANKATDLVMELDVLTGHKFTLKGSTTEWGLGTIMTLLNDGRANEGHGRYRTYSELVKAFETRAKPYLDEVVEISEL